MSNVFFIGDLHFGHTHIHKFRKQFPNEQVHRAHLMERWLSTINKRDVVYCMGDAAFTQDGLDDIGKLSGRKILVRGNHDLLPTEAYLNVFEEVYGALAWKGLWLTHIPIHPQELYGRTNVHGHCHRGGPTGIHEATPRPGAFAPTGTKATYFNTCCEFLEEPYTPINYQRMKEIIAETLRKGT